MSASADRVYQPDYAIPPGETLRSTLESVGMSQADLSRRTGLSTKHINQIIQGVAPISPETAIALERVLGVPARFWNTLEANYQARQVRLRKQDLSVEDQAWLARLPMKELVRRNLIPPASDPAILLDGALAFFGVASPGAWEAVWSAPDAAYRRSRVFSADRYATAAWLRIGELMAAALECAPFDRNRFTAALGDIRPLMLEEPAVFEPEMKRLCAEAGVAVVIVDEIKGCRASGATRWLSPAKALIQLSVRYRWEDVFWFSFFHEAGHVLLHGKREAFIEDGGEDSETESEADAFAANHLIPRAYEIDLLRIRTLPEARAFARQLGIPVGIVVGRLQREKVFRYEVGNHDRRRFRLVDARHAQG